MLIPIILVAMGINVDAQVDLPSPGTHCPELEGAPGDYSAEEVNVFFKATGPLRVNRGFTLPKDAVLDRRIEIMSPVYSPLVIDLNGGKIGDGGTLYLRSSKNADGTYCQLRDVTIKNGTLDGGIRVYGLGVNGQAGDVVPSSRKAGHTERAQAAAPSNILIDNVHFITHGGKAIYLSPGATHVVVTNCHFSGTYTSVSIYLDAESAYNTFENNTFATISKGKREVIAVDGSAHNVFRNNRFSATPTGGIFVYRNCGEGGAPRHQQPRFNVIVDNEFTYSDFKGSKPAIWLGSRQTRNYNHYCDKDSEYPFGSGLDDHDFARNNTVMRNNTTGRKASEAIVDDDAENSVQDNYSNVNPPIETGKRP